MRNKPVLLQKFPKIEAFDLEANVHDGYLLGRLIEENPNDIVCLILAPSPDSEHQQGAEVIGQVSANRVHEIKERYPELNTKYSHAVLCVWKPAISTVHAFIARNLRFCLSYLENETDRTREGSFALLKLKELSPYTRIFVVTPAQIFEGTKFPEIGAFVQACCQLRMITPPVNGDCDTPFFEGW